MVLFLFMPWYTGGARNVTDGEDETDAGDHGTLCVVVCVSMSCNAPDSDATETMPKNDKTKTKCCSTNWQTPVNNDHYRSVFYFFYLQEIMKMKMKGYQAIYV